MAPHLRIDAGRVRGLTEPTRRWTNDKPAAVAERDAWFDQLADALAVPGCSARRDPAGSDAACRSAFIEVSYPTSIGGRLPATMRPYVLIEAGRARVVPCVDRRVSSWVGDWIMARGGEGLPPAPLVTLRCVHPWVTALEKIDAIARRFPRADRPAASFVRHYEDIARIVALRDRLPVLEGGLITLRNDLLAAKDIRGLPDRTDAAFLVDAMDARWQEVALAWEAIDPWFWGPRSTLEEACEAIGALLDEVGDR